MNAERVLAEFRRELREVAWAGETLEATALVTRRSSADGRRNDVVAFDLDAASAGAAIQTELDRARDLGIGLEWKAFSFDSPPNLVDRLRTAGLTVGVREAVVVYDLADGLAPFEDASFENAPAFEVRRVDTEARLAEFRRVAEAAFGRGQTWTVEALAKALRDGQKGHDGYVASVDGEPASAGRLYSDPRSAFAGLYGGGTAPAFRGRGLYRTLVAARARDAAAFGARYLLVDALPTSLPILKKMGFVRIADTWPCEWEPAEP